MSLALAGPTPTLMAEDDAEAQARLAGRDDIVVTGARSEDSDAYTTPDQQTATRLSLSLKETPQSVSVITRAQINDFQLNDVNTLLASVPGVSVLSAETDRFYYSARGFDIQTFQIDGVGLPFAFGIQTGSIDTALYDRVEVVRGAPGLLSPTGNPSAVVNFIRKRPYREARATASAQYGSFDHVRLDGDVSVPLTANGSVRARAVGSYLDEDSYLDRYHLTRWTGYGIVEADLGADTVASVGYAHQKHRSRGAMWGAIPLYYTDGARIDFPRSANYAPSWSGWGITSRQIFGDVTHDLGHGWRAKVTALRMANDENDRLFYVYGNPDPATGLGIASYPGAFRGDTRNLTLDANIGGTVAIGGRDHDVMVGVNRAAERYRQYSSYDNAAIGVSVPLDTLFDGTFPEPAFPTPYTLSLDTHKRRETVYGLVRLNLADPLKLMLGGNYTHATSTGYSYATPTDYDRSRFLPFVGATYDLTPQLTAYASYATIFDPQTQFDADNRLLKPVQGDNIEAGIKGAWLAGRLNASIALFQARQKNTAEAAGFDAVRGRTIYRGVDATSRGIELEVAGELAPGLRATGGVSTMRVRGEQDQPVRTFVPRTTARLNISYTPPRLQQLTLGTSVRYQSDFYAQPGTLLTASGQNVTLRQGDYALVDLLARYALTDRISVSANVRNLTNARYLSSLTFGQSYGGPPRTVMGTISIRY